MRRLVFPGISIGSALWWVGGFAIVPLFTILVGTVFWVIGTNAFLAWRMFRRQNHRETTDESTVRSRVESLS